MFRPRKLLAQIGSYVVTAAPNVSENEDSRCEREMILDGLYDDINFMLTSHLGKACIGGDGGETSDVFLHRASIHGAVTRGIAAM